MRQFINKIRNPNLFIRLALGGGIWSANTLTWQETLPWTLNAPQ